MSRFWSNIGEKLHSVAARISGNPFYIHDAANFFGEIGRFYNAHYDAASSSRLTADWKTTTNTPYNDIKPNLQTMIARSRSSADNNGVSESIDNCFVSNILGARGIRPEPMVMENEEQENEAANKILREGWKRYNDQWDCTGHATYYENQKLMLKAIINSGSVLVNTVPAAKSNLLPIANEIVEPDRLDWSRDTYLSYTENNTKVKTTQFGIDLNETGIPIQYWLTGINKPFPAMNMDIRYRRRRPQQFIGVPWKAIILKYAWGLDNLIEDRLVSSRIQAMIGFWFNKRDLPMMAQKLNEKKNLSMEPGKNLFTETAPQIIESKQNIAETFDPLTRLILREVSFGVGPSYQAITKDLQGANFASSRANTISDRQLYECLQVWFSKDTVQRDHARFVRWMFITGQMAPLTLTDFNRDPWKWVQAYCRLPGWDWVDPLKDAQASIELIKNRMLSYEEYFSLKGQQSKTQLRKIAQELRFMKDLGKEFDVDMSAEAALQQASADRLGEEAKARDSRSEE